jgi:hypothetical protein
MRGCCNPSAGAAPAGDGERTVVGVGHEGKRNHRQFGQDRIAIHQCLREPVQLGRGLQAEFLDHVVPQALKQVQRVFAAAGPVQRHDELGGPVLVIRVAAHQRVELPQDLAVQAQPQFEFDPEVEHGQPGLLQPGPRGLDQRPARHVGQHRPTPQPQRGPHRPHRAPRVAGGHRPHADPLQLLVAGQVQRTGRRHQLVAAHLGTQDGFRHLGQAAAGRGGEHLA